jgi:ribosome maturation factor RimP
VTPVSVESEARTVAEAIETVATPVLRAHGVTLVDLDVKRGGRRAVARFFIDKPGGVSIEDCRAFSDEMGDVLDVSGLLPGSYDLEVSSPGLDRELRSERELAWACGRRVRVWTRESLDARREFEGQLAGVGEGYIDLQEGQGPRRIPRALVTKLRLDEVETRPPRSGRSR